LTRYRRHPQNLANELGRLEEQFEASHQEVMNEQNGEQENIALSIKINKRTGELSKVPTPQNESPLESRSEEGELVEAPQKYFVTNNQHKAMELVANMHAHPNLYAFTTELAQIHTTAKDQVAAVQQCFEECQIPQLQ